MLICLVFFVFSGACDCDGYWGGDTCDTCGIGCKNGGRKSADPLACSCNCNFGNDCARGTQRADCGCDCPDAWGGDRCDACALTAASCNPGGNGALDGCACDCSAVACAHGGSLRDSDCSCACAARFSGPTCAACAASAVCENGGTFDEATCVCECTSGYEGDSCTELTPAAQAIRPSKKIHRTLL